MDWGSIIVMALAIVGAGLITGGIVSYRGSARVTVRTFAASAVAVGVMMWAVVLITTPVSHGGEGPPAPTVELRTVID